MTSRPPTVNKRFAKEPQKAAAIGSKQPFDVPFLQIPGSHDQSQERKEE